MSNAGLYKQLQEKILILDGAMGTLAYAQSSLHPRTGGSKHEIIPESFNCDILSLTHPELIRNIHLSYLNAGAEIIRTNTFNASHFGQRNFGTAGLIEKIIEASVSIAGEACAMYMDSKPGSICWIAGSVGPGPVLLSKSCQARTGIPDVYSAMVDSYSVQIGKLTECGCHIIMIETIVDPVNASAAVDGYLSAMKQSGRFLPLIISATLTNRSGRFAHGETLTELFASLSHCNPLAVGINCTLAGGSYLREALKLAEKTAHFTCFCPGAAMGWPDMGRQISPAVMAGYFARLCSSRSVNIAGACCGSTPEHIMAIASVCRKSGIQVRSKKSKLISSRKHPRS